MRGKCGDLVYRRVIPVIAGGDARLDIGDISLPVEDVDVLCRYHWYGCFGSSYKYPSRTIPKIRTSHQALRPILPVTVKKKLVTLR